MVHPVCEDDTERLRPIEPVRPADTGYIPTVRHTLPLDMEREEVPQRRHQAQPVVDVEDSHVASDGADDLLVRLERVRCQNTLHDVKYPVF